MATPKFVNANPSFHTELKQRINQYFSETGKKATGGAALYTKAIVLTTLCVALYTHLVFFTPGVALAITECVLLGCVVAGIGFNVMHDGAHGSFSTRGWVNTIAAFSINVLGGSHFMWNMKHNVIHHAYTNIEGVDDDIDIRPWMRMSNGQPKYFFHRYQHLYFWALYSLLYVLWVFLLDYTKYFRRRIGSTPIRKITLRDHIIFWGFKVLNMFLYVILPVYMVGFSSWIIGFGAFTLVAGFVLSIVFQLAHTVEHTHFPVPDAVTGKLEDEWAIHQLKTTANFAPRNKVINWFVGGLNFQVEHHLFPKISHIHYPALSPIIKATCEEYDVPYIEYPKMSQAVKAHFLFLKQMGRGNKAA
jgi:linoleoyl-CoA desaturase